MIRLNLQKPFIKGRFTLPNITILCFIVWLSCHLLEVYKSSGITLHAFPSVFDYSLNSTIWISQITAMGGYILLGYLLIIYNNIFNINSQRSSIQTSVLFIFTTIIPQIHFLYPGLIATLCITIASYFFFKSYKEYDSSKHYFYIGIFWSIAFLILPKSIFLFPLMLFVGVSFNSLNAKSLTASFLGLLLPIWLFFSFCYLYDSIELFYTPFQDITIWNITDYTSLSSNKLATFLFTLLLVILSAAYLMISQPKMRIKTYHILNYFLILSIGLVILIILNPNGFYDYIPLCLVCTSFIISNALFTYQNRLSNLIFIISIIIVIGLLLFNIWIPLFNS